MRQFLVKGGRNEGEGGPLKEDCKREAMKSNREKNRSRREKGNAGRRAGEMCFARLEKCEISGEMKGKPEDAMLKDEGVYVVAGMPGWMRNRDEMRCFIGMEKAECWKCSGGVFRSGRWNGGNDYRKYVLSGIFCVYWGVLPGMDACPVPGTETSRGG